MSVTEPFKHSFTESTCLTEPEMFALLRGQLDSSRLHYVKQHLQQCDLCSTAVEGYRQPQVSLATTHQRLAGLAEPLAADKDKKNTFMPKVIAISVAVVGVLLFWFLSSDGPEKETKVRKRLSTTPVHEDNMFTQPDTVGNEVMPSISQDVTELSTAQELDTVVAIQVPEATEPEEPTTPVEAKPAAQPVAKLSGTVLNDLGSDGLGGAEIQAIRYGKTVARAKTKSDGSFVMSKLAPGVYDLVISKSGFGQIRQNKVFISAEEGNVIAISLINEEMRVKREQDSIENVRQREEAARRDLESKKSVPGLPPDDIPLPGEENNDYFKGKKQYEKGNYKKAIKYFDKVLEDNTGRHLQAAKWFKAISFILLGEYKDARPVLREIVNAKGVYSVPAQGKLESIEGK